MGNIKWTCLNHTTISLIVQIILFILVAFWTAVSIVCTRCLYISLTTITPSISRPNFHSMNIPIYENHYCSRLRPFTSRIFYIKMTFTVPAQYFLHQIPTHMLSTLLWTTYLIYKQVSLGNQTSGLGNSWS